MEYKVRTDVARAVVVVTVTGTCTRTGTAHMMMEARAAARDSRLPILYDLRAATPGQLQKSDIFWLARTVPAAPNGAAGRPRVATLFPSEHEGTARFWEDTFRNAGLEARAFEEEAEAVAWLRVSSAAP